MNFSILTSKILSYGKSFEKSAFSLFLWVKVNEARFCNWNISSYSSEMFDYVRGKLKREDHMHYVWQVLTSKRKLGDMESTNSNLTLSAPEKTPPTKNLLLFWQTKGTISRPDIGDHSEVFRVQAGDSNGPPTRLINMLKSGLALKIKSNEQP